MSMTLDTAQGLATALGCGLLIGLERERRKGQGPDRLAAGIRTFALAAISGAVAHILDVPGLMLSTALCVGGLGLVTALKRHGDDPGVTTALALQATYLLGVLSVTRPLIAAGTSVLLTILLAARSPLHHFSKFVLSETELRDGLLLAAIALIAIPLLPDEPISEWMSTSPQRLCALTVLFLCLQALGYVAQRLVGLRFGLVLSGLMAGFVSSSATIAAFGARARLAPAARATYVAGALSSCIATITLLFAVVLTVYPKALPALASSLLCTLVATVVVTGLSTVRLRDQPVPVVTSGHAFNLLHAIVFSVVLTIVSSAIAYALRHSGVMAANGMAFLGGAVDVHASAASSLSLGSGGQLPVSALRFPIVLAYTANAISKLVAAFVSGGTAYGLRVGLGLFIVVAAAWLPMVVA
jgi:uncharacterized membrane protein (DUF4010 family)